MARVNRIQNAFFIPPEPISFKQRIQTNYGVKPPKGKNIVEDNLFTVFTSKIRDVFGPEARERAQKIEDALREEGLSFYTIV